ncbi:hypothetical protein [Prescottella equi]|uniref:hypothetical protein n=1 Tax=Rhodococcus hoagii TaxID=43767 RepID=UPI002740B37F|nr:hypothetical protein [Prescottella equi]MDP8015157.1 hypothetical protein [Prescottella equi]
MVSTVPGVSRVSGAAGASRLQGTDLPGRFIAIVGLTSAAAHAAMLGRHDSVWGDVVVLLLIGACLWCSRHLWNRPRPHHYGASALMSLMMLAVHLPLGGGHGHHGSGLSYATMPLPSTVTVLTLALAGTELVLAYGVLHLRTRSVPAVVLAGAAAR